MHRRGGYNVPWTQEEIETTVKMYKEHKTNHEIGCAIGKTGDAVKTKLGKLRKQFDLAPRSQALLKKGNKKGPPKGANLHESAPYRDIPTSKGSLVAASNKEASLSATIGRRKRGEAERQGG